MVNALTGSVALGVKEGRTWGLDNGACSGRFDPAVLCAALDRYAPWRAGRAFVVSPDVPGAGDATLTLLRTWASAIRHAGYRATFVLHPGVTALPDCDALLIPASNLRCPDVPRLTQEARLAGKWVHVGRVNSERRRTSMVRLGAHSVDGTYMAFTGVQRGSSTMARRVEQAAAQATLTPLLTGHAERVSVLQSPPEGGHVLVAFTDEGSSETYTERLSTDLTYGPVTLAAPHQAQHPPHWALTHTPRRTA